VAYLVVVVVYFGLDFVLELVLAFVFGFECRARLEAEGLLPICAFLLLPGFE